MKKIISSYSNKNITIDWVTFYYDMPIKGLCSYKNTYYIFNVICPSWDDKNDDWNHDGIIILNEINRLKLFITLINKKLFEWFIGYNCSYSHPKHKPPAKRFISAKFSKIKNIKHFIYYKVICNIIPKAI